MRDTKEVLCYQMVDSMVEVEKNEQRKSEPITICT